MAPPHVGVVLSFGRLIAEIPPAIDDLLGRTPADAKLQTLTGHDSVLGAVAWSGDGKWIASAGGDHVIKLWDGTTLKAARTLPGHAGAVSALAFSPKSKFLASAGGDQRILLWDLTLPAAVAVPLAGHTSVISSVAFSPDGKMLASGGGDQVVKLWSVPE